MADHGTPLRGREAESTLLHARLEAARRHGRGSVVLLEGAAGSGKSRLLHETQVLASRAGARVVRLCGDPDAHVIPHGPLLDAAGAGPRPLLTPSDLDKLPLGPEQGFWLGNELQSSLEELAVHTPVLVSVDDLQWCDPATLRLLRTLPRRLATEAIVWVLAVRTGETVPALEATVRALVDAGGAFLELHPLDDSAVHAITVDILGARPDSGVLASVARAGGQPLLLVELLRGLVGEQLVRLHDGSAELVSDEVPARLRDAVARRTRRLSPAARELLRVAAMLGRRSPPDLLAAVLGLTPPALLNPAQEVIDAGLMSDDGEHLGFPHDLIREAVAASVPAGLARVLRRHAADVMVERGAPTLHVATMLAESSTRGDLEAVAALREAAATLSSRSTAAAADFSVRALELLPDDSPLRAQIVVESVMLLWQCGRAVAAQQMASTMLAGALGTDVVGEALIRLGLARFTTRYSCTETVRQCEVALALPGLPDSLRTELNLVLAVNHGLAGDPDAVSVVLARVAGRQQSPEPLLAATRARAETYAAFHRREWDNAFRRHGDVKRLDPAGDLVAPVDMWEAAMWTSIGRPARSLALIDPEVEAARHDGRVGSLLMWSSMRSRALYDAGRLDEARCEAESVLELEDLDVVGGLRDLLVVYSLVRGGLDTGQGDVVRAHRARVRQMTTDTTGQIRRNGLWLEALIADRAGDVASARAALGDAAMMLGRPGPALAGLPDVHDEVALTRMALCQGERQVAARAVDAAEQRAGANPSHPTAVASACHARALLDDDEACLREAVHHMNGGERLLVRASALEDLGRVVARDRASEAVPLLDGALDLYGEAGAEPHAARVRRRLRVLGVRRRRTPSASRAQGGLAALTHGERRVVDLVADGRSNRQVAQELFLSPHTVNTHLRNAFAKLDVRSRVELTRLVVGTVEEG